MTISPDVQGILDTEETILIDSCVISRSGRIGRHTGIAKYLYDIGKYGDIDPAVLEKAVDASEDTLSIFRNEKLITTSQVVSEYKNFLNILRTSLRFLNQRERNLNRARIKSRDGNKQKGLLEKITDNANKTLRALKASVFNDIDKRVLTLIVDYLIAIDNAYGVKVDYLNQQDEHHIDNRTDEGLVALSFYLAATENRSNAILTTDNDLQALVVKSCEMLRGDSNPGMSYMAKLLIRSPSRIYLLKSINDGVVNVVDTSRLL